MEKNRKTISIPQLRKIVDAILSNLEDSLPTKEIELAEDYYWNIPDDELYMGDYKQDGVTVGSLYDDLDFLLPLLDDKDQAFPLMLIHVAPILRYLANEEGRDATSRASRVA